MLEIIIQGRGGQGAKPPGICWQARFMPKACTYSALPATGCAAGYTSQSSYIRADSRPCACAVTSNAQTLFCALTPACWRALAGCSRQPHLDRGELARSAQNRPELSDRRIVAVDALSISREHGLGRIVNSAFVGRVGPGDRGPSMDILSQAIQANTPKLQSENAAACVAGYRCADAQLAGSLA